MPEIIEYLPEKPPEQGSSDKAEGENKFFARDVPPNTVLVKLWSGGHLSWHSESSAPVLALIMLAILCLLLFLLVLITLIFKGDFGDIFQILGNAISAVVGAVVGSSATTTRRR